MSAVGHPRRFGYKRAKSVIPLLADIPAGRVARRNVPKSAGPNVIARERALPINPL